MQYIYFKLQNEAFSGDIQENTMKIPCLANIHVFNIHSYATLRHSSIYQQFSCKTMKFRNRFLLVMQFG